jgi:hypothetical protein
MSQELTPNVKSRVRNLEIGVGAKDSLTTSTFQDLTAIACSRCLYRLLSSCCPILASKSKLAILSNSREMPVGLSHPISFIL